MQVMHLRCSVTFERLVPLRIAVGFNTMGLWTLTKGMVIHILGIAIGIRYT